MDIANAEVIIKIPNNNGSVMVVRGRVKNLEISTSRDVQPIYSIGSADPHMIYGSPLTEFTVTGYTNDTQLHEANLGIRVEKPCRWADSRWADIAEELK